MISRIFALITLILLSSISWAQIPSDAVQMERNGCEAATEFARVADIYALALPGSEANAIQREMQLVQRRTCRGEFSSSEAILYTNGATATTAAGDDTATWYWPNGNLITSTALSETTSVYYPNGNLVSTGFRTIGSTFFYPDGRAISASAGLADYGINDVYGNTLSMGPPDFSVSGVPGRLNAAQFLSFIIEVNAGISTPGRTLQCTTEEVDQRLDRVLDFLQGDQDMMAAQELGAIRMCL